MEEVRGGGTGPRPSGQWLLIDLLEPGRPCIIAVGDAVKDRVPLTVFIRSRADQSALQQALMDATANRRSAATPTTGGRVAFVEPLLDDAGVVHGAWARVARVTLPTADRSDAWAFTWDLTEGIATRSPGLGYSGDKPPRWSIAEALQVVDLGTNAVEALTQIVAAPPGTFHHSTVLQHRPDGTTHRVDIVTRIGGHADHRILRGLSHDLGPAAEQRPSGERASSVAELVALGTIRPDEWRAVVNLTTLELVCWFGPAPDGIAWQYDADTRQQRIHHDDREKAEAMAAEVAASVANQVVQQRLRLLGRDGVHVAFDVSALRLSLDTDVRAALVTLTRAAH